MPLIDRKRLHLFPYLIYVSLVHRLLDDLICCNHRHLVLGNKKYYKFFNRIEVYAEGTFKTRMCNLQSYPCATRVISFVIWLKLFQEHRHYRPTSNGSGANLNFHFKDQNLTGTTSASLEEVV